MALNAAPVSWKSCHQIYHDVTLPRSSSEPEAEYVAASAAAQENIYLLSLVACFDRTQHETTSAVMMNFYCSQWKI